VFPEKVRLAPVALIRLELVGKAYERDRRPTQRELDDLIRYFDEKPRQLIPMSRIIRFAVATAMRQEEICSFTWDDVDIRNRMVSKHKCLFGWQQAAKRINQHEPPQAASTHSVVYGKPGHRDCRRHRIAWNLLGDRQGEICQRNRGHLARIKSNDFLPLVGQHET
jgi:hypothetical protein